MKTCCDFCSMLVLTFIALILSVGNLQAQTTKPKCDLSKCTPEEKAACAKICASKSLATTVGLTDFLFADKAAAKPNCQPAACAKNKTTTAKLVSTETKTAPVYSNSLELKEEELVSKEKKKNCTMTCKKKETTSL